MTTTANVIRLTDTIFAHLTGSKPRLQVQDFTKTVEGLLELPNQTNEFLDVARTTANDFCAGAGDVEWLVCDVVDNAAFFIYPNTEAGKTFFIGDLDEPCMGDHVDAKVFGIVTTLLALNELEGRYTDDLAISNMLTHKKTALTDIICYNVQEASPHVSEDEHYINEIMESFVWRYEG